MIQTICEPDLFKPGTRCSTRLGERPAIVQQLQRSVLQGGRARDEVKRLEYDANVAAPVESRLPCGKGRKVPPVEEDLAGVGRQ